MGFEWVGALVGECRKRNLEVIWNHRFGEVDLTADGKLDMETLHPLKAAHPDWVIKSWWWQGLWNAASPGLRAFKVKQLRELVEKYNLDGVQVDFARHVPALPPGHQWEQREQATAFMRSMRAMLMEVETKKNHPLLLSAKVPRNLEGCKKDGFDVWTWGKEQLVDELTLGSRSMDVDVNGFRVAVGPRVRLHPCFDDHHATDGYRSAPIEYLRGVFANWWEQGANGITTFNFAVAPPERAQQVGDALAPLTHQQVYHEGGSLASMERKDKVFAVERRGGYPWAEGFFNRNDTAPLPVQLANDGRPNGFRLRIAESHAVVKASMQVVLYGSIAGDDLEVSCNDVVLKLAQDNPTWKDPQIFSPRPQPASGGTGLFTPDPSQNLRLLSYAVNNLTTNNTMRIRVIKRGHYPPGSQIQVEKIELAAQYGGVSQ
jgi:hypothetical protein